MKKMSIALLLCLMALISACGQGKTEDLFRYEHSFVGDNNAVSQIIKHLPEGQTVEQIELHTIEQPYGITLYVADDFTEEDFNVLAAYLLKLVDNCEWIAAESSTFTEKIVRDKELTEKLHDIETDDELRAYLNNLK